MTFFIRYIETFLAMISRSDLFMDHITLLKQEKGGY